ncbi:hypothetical protein AB0926_32555 [Streptomyces griseoincarnatus]
MLGQPKISFDVDCGLGGKEQDRIKDALLNVAVSGDEGASELQCRNQGRWPADVKSVTVHGRLAGGRGGADVLKISVKRKKGISSLQVAKLMPYDEAAKEWKAYEELKSTFDSSLYVPISAVSRAVHDKRGQERPCSVVVYRHVSAWDHAPGSLESLEDLIADAVMSPARLAECSGVLTTVLRSLSSNLYATAWAEEADLEGENRSLGDDLRLEVDKVEGSGAAVRLVYGNPAPDDVFPQPSSSEVLRSTTSPPGPGRSLRVGGQAEFTLEKVSVDGTSVWGNYHSTRVRVDLVGAASQSQQAGKVRAGRTVEVQGLLTAVRAEQWSAFLQEHFADEGSFCEDDSNQSLRYEGVTVGHPLAALHGLLVADSGLRARSAVHGDLNPRNVILSGHTPFLIDFATFKREHFTLTDVSWLEMCILRDCMARLSWLEMVRLQRYLGLLTLLQPHQNAETLGATTGALAQSLAGDSPVLERCLRILWQVRCGTWDAVPAECREQWPRHYLEHLVLSACRTFKWPSPDAPERVRVSAAAAGVAGEFLSSAGVFRYWGSQDQEAVARILLATDQDDDVTAGLLSEAAAAIEDPALRTEVIKRLSAGPLLEIRRALHQRYTTAARAENSVWGGDDTYIRMEGRQLKAGEAYVRQGHGALTVQGQDCLELLEQRTAMVLLAEPGGGKSRITRELRIRRTADHSAGPKRTLLPLQATASQILEFLQQRQSTERTVAKFLLQLANAGLALSEERLGHLIALGAVHLTIDDLHVVAERDQRKILAWIKRVRDRQPRLRLLVCQRVGDFHLSVLRWPTVVVHTVREDAARAYATEVLRRRHQDNWQEPLAELESRLFADPGAAALRGLAGKPQFLRLLVHHFVETGQVPANLGGLVRKYLDNLLASAPVEQNSPDRLLGGLARLAEELGSAGSLGRQQALEVLDSTAQAAGTHLSKAQELLAALLDTSVVVESSRRISFRDPLVQSYCAAIALQLYPPDQSARVRELILRHGWRETAVLLVADERTQPGTVLTVVKAGVEASAWYGALLLQAAPETCTREVHDAFLRHQYEVLRSPYSGVPAWKRSAYALAKYAVPSAQRVLIKAASAPESAAEAAQAALDGLVMMHQWSVPGATQQLTDVITGLLDQVDQGNDTGGDVRVVVQALRSIQVACLNELAGYAWTRVDPSQPWDVLRQAWQTLRQLNVRPDRARYGVYAQACTSQLSALDAALRSTADTATADALNAERLQALEDLTAVGAVETLLEYRFRAGLAECPGWGEMLQKVVTTRRAGTPAASAVSALLDDSVLNMVGFGCDQWKRLLVVGDEGLAVLAAHYILAAKDVVSMDLLAEVAAHGTAWSLSVVAAFVHCLPPDGHKALDQLLEPFLVGLDADMVEAVASFVSAAETLNQDTGRRLALRVQHALAAQGLAQEALHWPWCTTWRRALPPRAEIPLFLHEQSQSPAWRAQGPDATLLSLLGSADVLLDAPYVKPVSLTPGLSERLGDLKPATADGAAAHRFVLLAASIGLPEELDFIKQVAVNDYNVRTVIRHAHGHHGLVEVTLAAHAVTAIGYLGMLAALEDPDLDVAPTISFLEEMGRDTGDMHPSMERARLIGLGYWGQLAPLLGALCAREDPILASAVRNIVNHWLPGPRTSTGKEPYFTKVAETLSEELHSRQLPPQTRALLTELRTGIEDRLGRYVI